MSTRRLYLLAAALLITGATAQTPPAATCGPAPPPPPETDAWAVQLSDGTWDTLVPGWVAAPAPDCWVLGRVLLTYVNHDDPQGEPNDTTPGPWYAGLDYPEGEPCPAEALAGCYLLTIPWAHPPIRAP